MNHTIPTVIIESAVGDASWSESFARDQGRLMALSFDNFLLGMPSSHGADTVSPTFSSASHNSTVAGQSARFSVLWNDNFALHPSGTYVFSTNNSGSWVNDTAVSFATTPSWAEVTKTLNESTDILVGYRWYANDTSGNWNVTPIYTLSTTLTTEIVYSKYKEKGKTSNLNNVETDDIEISDLIIDDLTYGKIEFLEPIILNNSFNLDNVFNFGYNFISVDSSAYESRFNKSAIITMYNLYEFGQPRILKNGQNCNDCVILNWDSGIKRLIFNITSFSEYSVEEENQSKVQNDGRHNISYYLLMKTQRFSGSWIDEDIVVNDSLTGDMRTTLVNNLTKLDYIWNEKKYNSSSLSGSEGIYRVYVAIQDSSGNILQDNLGNNLVKAFNFTLDNTRPRLSLIHPANHQIIPLSQGGVNFNWSVSDNIDTNISCDLIINGVVEQSFVIQNNSVRNYYVSGLMAGDHLWNVSCWDKAVNINNSVTRNVSILYDLNAAPNIPVVSINSTDGTNRTLQNLNCRGFISDPDGDNLNVSVRWYKEGVLNLTRDFNNSYVNGTNFVATLGFGNTTKHQNWSCSIRVYDGEEFSEWGNSNELRVLNSAPSVSLTVPTNFNKTTNRTPEFTWSGTDDDGDILTYEFNITDFMFSGTKDCTDKRFIDGLSSASYVPTSDLRCLHDNGYYYKWRVRANDGEGYGSWSSEYTLNITASIILSMVNGEILLTSLTPLNPVNDTDNNNPAPFVIENRGNAVTNISVNATQLWNTQPTASSYYQFKADNASGYSGAFRWVSSITSWFNFPFTGSVVAIDSLNYTANRNRAEIDIRVELPLNEDPGSKNSIITFTGGLAEG
jgi:hypothetical protein